MSNNRQDSWTTQEDLLLAETTLRCIREGSTQLAAFEQVGKLLYRTSAACGFRWNSLIRKQYEDAIKSAKQERKELNKAKKKKSGSNETVEKAKIIVVEASPSIDISLKEVINFLKDLENQGAPNRTLEERCSVLEAELAVANEQNAELTHTLEKIKAEHQLIQEDYMALISIMNRAKTLITKDQDDFQTELKVIESIK